jgi:hypothetical protein
MILMHPDESKVHPLETSRISAVPAEETKTKDLPTPMVQYANHSNRAERAAQTASDPVIGEETVGNWD